MFQRSRLRKNIQFRKFFFTVFLLHIILLLVTLRVPLQIKKEMNEGAILKIKIYDRPDIFDKKQVVQSDDPLEEKTPAKTKYLSDKNRQFDRQTRAHNRGTFSSSGGGNKTIKLSDLGAYRSEHDPFKAMIKNVKNKEIKEHQTSSTNDYLENIPLGDITALNTEEFKYYGFYFRIKQKLEQFWGRSIQETAEVMASAGRRLATDNQHVTSLQITLDELGEIIRIRVVDTSGVKELDDAAIEAFNQAGPFPNPPKGLIVDGKVILEWGFVVKS